MRSGPLRWIWLSAMGHCATGHGAGFGSAPGWALAPNNYHSAEPQPIFLKDWYILYREYEAKKCTYIKSTILGLCHPCIPGICKKWGFALGAIAQNGFWTPITRKIHNQIQKLCRSWIRGPNGSIGEKSRGTKISCYYPFQAVYGMQDVFDEHVRTTPFEPAFESVQNRWEKNHLRCPWLIDYLAVNSAKTRYLKKIRKLR